MTIYPGRLGLSLSGAGLVAFHGGGWVEGSPQMWEKFGLALAPHGITVFGPAYRLLGQEHPTRSLWDLVEDAHAAFAWVHANADEFSLDPARIGAAGGSAGGHLALSLALLPPQPPAVRSPLPAFLILCNPVTDTSPEGFGQHLLGEVCHGLSPLHALDASSLLPPTLMLHGTADTTTPIEGARRFRDRGAALGARCDLREYPGRKHAFFNHEPDLSDAIHAMLAFLESVAAKQTLS